MTVVCIAGMHRSGTSMITHMLNDCGVYLGPADRIINATPDNPDGYWENQDFIKINDRLLAEFEGGWDVPPDFPENWFTSEKISPIRRDAADLIQGFKDYPFWGWKDPRNSLTAPFWNSLINDLKVIIPLRNPLAVHESLNKRGYSTTVFSYRLWLSYQNRILDVIPNYQRVITHFESYFSDPRAELRRVLAFINLDVEDGVIEKACEEIHADHKHYSPTLANLIGTKPGKAVFEHYISVCTEAGDVYSQIQSKELQEIIGYVSEQQPEISGFLRDIETLQANISGKEQLIRTLSSQLESKDQFIRALSSSLNEKELSIQSLSSQLESKDKSIQSLSAELQTAQSSINTQESLIQRQTSELTRIHSSSFWKAWGAVRFLKKLFYFPLERFGKRNDLALIKASGFYDQDWYLSKNPDVAQAKVDPLLHYLENGGFEGRDPGPRFSSNYYLTTNQDVKNAGINPLLHYLKFGRMEERLPRPVIPGKTSQDQTPE